MVLTQLLHEVPFQSFPDKLIDTLTFPIASSALSKNRIIPKKRKNTPNPVKPIPISANHTERQQLNSTVRTKMNIGACKHVVRLICQPKHHLNNFNG